MLMKNNTEFVFDGPVTVYMLKQAKLVTEMFVFS